ncbi:MAG: immunoglobulin domain-containing protein, partial [Chitinispirillaceae bacterium]|nr:immunoglobulin domain-containing protein [Chitinispirillaceae bacterium]
IGTNPLRYAWYKNSVTAGNLIAGATSSTFTRSNAQVADSGNYYVVVSNEYGGETSNAARLIVNAGNLPSITTHPSAVSVYQTQPATFTVVASGMGTLRYQWYKVVNSQNTAITVAATGLTTVSMRITATVFSDSGLYRCVVTNDYGSVTSNTARLTVLSGEPTITTHPAPVTVYATQRAVMRVVASGVGTRSYQWYKVVNSQNSLLSGRTLDSIVWAQTEFSDSGLYRCIVTNAYGSASSNTAQLTVNNGRPVITVDPRDTAVLQGTAWNMSVTATTPSGTSLTYAWYKSGVATIQGNARILSKSAALLTDAGGYYCIVSNVYGPCTTRTATLTVGENKTVNNPVMLSGSRSSDTRVALRVNRLTGLIESTPDQFFTWAPDTVLIWYSTTWPTTINLQTVNVKIGMDRIRQNGGDFFDTLLTVPRLANCGNYYFMGTVKWRSTAQPPAQPSIPVFGGTTTGAAVWMCDTTTLVNPLTMSFGYTPPDDSVVVRVTGITNTQIRWDLISAMVLRYQVGGTGSWSEVSVPSAEITTTEPVHAITVQNARFAGDVATVAWQLLFRGVNNNKSDTVRNSSVIGASRPENTLSLSTTEIGATTVGLAWENTGEPYDSFHVWYATIPIPDSAVSPDIFTLMPVSATENTVMIRGLKEETTYHFGIQGSRVRKWSNITPEARAQAQTLKDTSQAIRNTLKLRGIVYDTLTNMLNLTWYIDTVGFQHAVGITWLPHDENDPPPLPTDFLEPSTSPQIGRIVYNDADELRREVTCSIDLAGALPPLEYAKGYYFGLRVSRVGEKWSLPTDSSMGYYLIPQPKVVPVVIFRNTDVVSAFSGTVVLRKVDNIEVPVNLRLVEGLSPAANGLVQVSPVAFSLETASDLRYRLLVGLEYNSAWIPQGASLADVRMYHYDGSRDIWLLDTAALIADTVRPVLYVQTLLSNCKYPFLLAVDIVPPVITVKGDTASAISWGDSIPMTLLVEDNIANPAVSLHAGRGDDAPRMHDTLKGLDKVTDVEMPWLIPSGEVQGECGIRAYFMVNDGRFSPSVNVSRDVRLTKSDDVKPEIEQWVPLGATVVLAATGVKQALDEYGDAATWKYDIFNLRLFRFIGKGWQEYSEARENQFAFIPGRVIWLKTRMDNAIDFGDGRSVSLKQPYSIVLPGKSWTDFCLPYRFNIRVGDLLRVNDSSVTAALQFYQWRKPDTKDGRYSAREFYLPLNSIGKTTDTFFYRRALGDKAAYSVWNDLSTETVLNIPPLPLPMSAVRSAKIAAQQAAGWSVAVRSSVRDGELSPVFCAYVAGGSGTLAYPVPPSWSKVGVGIFDHQRKEVYGNVITREIANGGYSYELVFENGLSERASISYTVERLSGKDVEIAVIDPATGSIAAGESALTVDVAGNSREYRLLAIGSPGYIDGYGWKVERGAFNLCRISPNPFRGALRIEYSVPYGGIESIRCDLIDQRGRVVWSARSAGKVHPGRNSIVWTPDRKVTLAAGAYFVRLAGYDGKGKKTGEKLAKVLFLK